MKTIATHEDLDRTVEFQGSASRSFGLVMAVFFLVVGTWPIVRGGGWRPWALGTGIAFAAVALARPSLLDPLNSAWTRLGRLLQQVVSPVALGLLFFVVISPVALVMKLLGRRPLALGFEPGARSYWIARRPPGPAPDSMRQQF